LETEWLEAPLEGNQGDPSVLVDAMGKPSTHLTGGSQSVRSSEEAGNDRGAKGRRKVALWGSIRNFYGPAQMNHDGSQLTYVAPANDRARSSVKAGQDFNARK
jgi:hypothetical protein